MQSEQSKKRRVEILARLREMVSALASRASDSDALCPY